MQSLFKILKMEALAVNDQVSSRDQMRRYRFEYNRLDSFDSPEPKPLDRNINMNERGIWLRWILPRADRTEGEDGQFPYIPNRYLITRISRSGKETVSKILESDCPVSAKLTDEEYDRILPYSSRYIVGEETWNQLVSSGDEYRSTAYEHKSAAGNGYYLNIGVPFDARDWEEREKSASCGFLTACAPGNPNFTGYVPFNSNVLSYFDNLKDVDDDTFDYIVIGWHSDAQGRPFFYSGQLFEVQWKRTDYDAYEDELADIKQSGNLNVAIGENSSQSFLAYLKSRLYYNENMSGDELEHFMLLLSAMDAGNVNDLSDTGSGWQVGENAVLRQFRIKSGGNRETAELDEATRLLHSLQSELFDIWWKKGYFDNNSGVCSEDVKKAYEKELDASVEGSLASRTISQYEKVSKLRKELDGKEENSEEEGGGDRMTPAGRYWRRESPYIIVSGFEQPEDMEIAGDEGETDFREERELLVSDWGEQEAPCKLPETKGSLPRGAELLYAEAVYILEHVYGKDEEVVQGKMPGYEITRWKQKWKPAFMEWRMDYQEMNEFEFNGKSYVADRIGKLDAGEIFAYGGIIALTPHKKDLFADQLERLGDNSGNEQVKAAAQKVREWKLLGQELSGFHEQMAQHDIRAFRRPVGETFNGRNLILDDVLGFNESDREEQRIGGAVDSVPYVDGNVVPPFRRVQNGKGRLSDLIFYDAFGRCLTLIQAGNRSGMYESNNFPLIVSDSMKSRKNSEESRNRFLLRPGLLQYARLSAEFQGDGDNGIYGFIVANYLSHSLLVYSGDGALAGELSLAAGKDGGRSVVYSKINDVPEGVLQDFIDSQTGKEEAAFAAMLDVIDDAFWTMSAAGGSKEERIALLAGRPLALSKMQIYIDLYGEPIKNTDWNADEGGKDAEPGFPLRLGELSGRGDGVVGYFEDGTFSVFRSTAEPSTECESIVQIGQETEKASAWLKSGCGSANAAAPYILYDPLLAVHIYSGIFPVKKVYQDKDKMLDIYKNMELRFRAGPLVRENDKEAYSVREGCVVFAVSDGDDGGSGNADGSGNEEDNRKKEFKWLGKEGIWNEQQ